MDLKSALEHLREAAKRMQEEKKKTGRDCERTCHCAFCELEHALSCTALGEE